MTSSCRQRSVSSAPIIAIIGDGGDGESHGCGWDDDNGDRGGSDDCEPGDCHEWVGTWFWC